MGAFGSGLAQGAADGWMNYIQLKDRKEARELQRQNLELSREELELQVKALKHEQNKIDAENAYAERFFGEAQALGAPPQSPGMGTATGVSPSSASRVAMPAASGMPSPMSGADPSLAGPTNLPLFLTQRYGQNPPSNLIPQQPQQPSTLGGSPQGTDPYLNSFFLDNEAKPSVASQQSQIMQAATSQAPTSIDTETERKNLVRLAKYAYLGGQDKAYEFMVSNGILSNPMFRATLAEKELTGAKGKAELDKILAEGKEIQFRHNIGMQWIKGDPQSQAAGVAMMSGQTDTALKLAFPQLNDKSKSKFELIEDMLNGDPKAKAILQVAQRMENETQQTIVINPDNSVTVGPKGGPQPKSYPDSQYLKDQIGMENAQSGIKGIDSMIEILEKYPQSLGTPGYLHKIKGAVLVNLGKAIGGEFGDVLVNSGFTEGDTARSALEVLSGPLVTNFSMTAMHNDRLTDADYKIAENNVGVQIDKILSLTNPKDAVARLKAVRALFVDKLAEIKSRPERFTKDAPRSGKAPAPTWEETIEQYQRETGRLPTTEDKKSEVVPATKAPEAEAKSQTTTKTPEELAVEKVSKMTPEQKKKRLAELRAKQAGGK